MGKGGYWYIKRTACAAVLYGIEELYVLKSAFGVHDDISLYLDTDLITTYFFHLIDLGGVETGKVVVARKPLFEIYHITRCECCHVVAPPKVRLLRIIIPYIVIMSIVSIA